jgi:hypothetical protein
VHVSAKACPGRDPGWTPVIATSDAIRYTQVGNRERILVKIVLANFIHFA